MYFVTNISIIRYKKEYAVSMVHRTSTAGLSRASVRQAAPAD
jgi:hypothetical protein